MSNSLNAVGNPNKNPFGNTRHCYRIIKTILVTLRLELNLNMYLIQDRPIFEYINHIRIIRSIITYFFRTLFLSTQCHDLQTLSYFLVASRIETMKLQPYSCQQFMLILCNLDSNISPPDFRTSCNSNVSDQNYPPFKIDLIKHLYSTYFANVIKLEFRIPFLETAFKYFTYTY